jgi:hypothetical protein
MQLLIQNIYCNAWNNPDLFTIEIDHNGFLYGLRDNLTYISGTIDYFENCHSETFSMLWVEEFMHVLDYQFDGRLHLYWLKPRKDMSNGHQCADWKGCASRAYTRGRAVGDTPMAWPPWMDEVMEEEEEACDGVGMAGSGGDRPRNWPRGCSSASCRMASVLRPWYPLLGGVWVLPMAPSQA